MKERKNNIKSESSNQLKMDENGKNKVYKCMKINNTNI